MSLGSKSAGGDRYGIIMLTLSLVCFVSACLVAGAVVGATDDDRHEWAVGAGIVGLLFGVVAGNVYEVLVLTARIPAAVPGVPLVPLLVGSVVAFAGAGFTFTGARVGAWASRRGSLAPGGGILLVEADELGVERRMARAQAGRSFEERLGHHREELGGARRAVRIEGGGAIAMQGLD